MYTCAICTWAARQQRAQHRCSATHPRIHTHTHTHTHTHPQRLLRLIKSDSCLSQRVENNKRKIFSATVYSPTVYTNPYIQTRMYKPVYTKPCHWLPNPTASNCLPSHSKYYRGKKPKKNANDTGGLFLNGQDLGSGVYVCVCV